MRVARSLATAVTVALLLAATGPDDAHADSYDGATTNASASPTGDGADVRATQLGSAGAPIRSSGGTVSCQFIEVGEQLDTAGYGGVNDLIAGFNPASELKEGWWYFIACTHNGTPQGTNLFQYRPGELPIDPLFLALEAVDTLTIAYPSPSTSPPIDFQQLVGLPTWLWIDQAGYQPTTATASIPGLTVTATATPTRITWTMGDDTDPIVCDSPGTPYDHDLPDDQQSTDCSHIYQHAGTYTAQATVDWAIAWAATNGDGGTLPPTSRTTTFELDVIERQAVIIDNP